MTRPEPEIAVRAVAPEPFAAVPALRFDMAVSDPSGRPVYTIALAAQIQIDADRRAYPPEVRERLVDLFGRGERLPETAGALQLGRVDVLVPSFAGEGSFELALPCSADLELATTRYLSALNGGAVPLTFNFSGTIFYSAADDRLQLTQVPWSCAARYRLPSSVWRDLITTRWAASGFVRLQPETLDLLRARRAELGLPTMDAAIADALRAADREENGTLSARSGHWQTADPAVGSSPAGGGSGSAKPTQGGGAGGGPAGRVMAETDIADADEAVR